MNLTAGQSEFKCQYCEAVFTDQQAEAEFNESKNSKATGALLLAETARASGNHKAAYDYYNKAIENDPNCVEAWYQKANCGLYREYQNEGWYKFRHFYNTNITTEAITAWENAIMLAKNSDGLKKRVATEICHIVPDSISYFGTGHWVSKFQRVTTVTPREVLSEVATTAKALFFALELNPAAKEAARLGYEVCNKNFVQQVFINRKEDYVTFDETDLNNLEQLRAGFAKELKRIDSNWNEQTETKLQMK